MADTSPNDPMPPQLIQLLAAQGFAPADAADSTSKERVTEPAAASRGETKTARNQDAAGKPPERHPPADAPGGSNPRSSGTTRPRAHVSRRRVWIVAGVVAVVIVIFLLIGILPHRSRQQQLAARARAAALADSIPLVGVQRVTRSAAEADLMLPGTLQSNHETPIYARSSGYVKQWYADIGARVHAGQLLATIEAPDLDQQLAQAQQEVSNAQAALQLNQVNLARWKILYRDSTVTKQELDTYQSGYDASVATVAAAQANVRRVAALVGFEQITAPFDGVITARNVDNGVFVTSAGTTNTPVPAGTGGNTIAGTTTTSELYRIASTDTVRVYLGVPQAYAPAVRIGLPATLSVAEQSGRAYSGRITRTADAVDASSLTLLTEVDVVNRDRSLLPGMYAQAHFRFQRVNPPILMPATAMIFRTSAPQAAVIGGDSVVHFHSLGIGRDYGTVIEVDSGLANGDYVVAEPSDDLRDGERVHARVETESGAPGGDTRAGRPIAAPRPASQSQHGQGRGQSGSGSRTQPGQSGTGGQGAAGSPTYKPPPQLEEGFPGAPPPPKP